MRLGNGIEVKRKLKDDCLQSYLGNRKRRRTRRALLWSRGEGQERERGARRRVARDGPAAAQMREERQARDPLARNLQSDASVGCCVRPSSLPNKD